MTHTIKVEIPERELGKVDASIEIREDNILLGTLLFSKGELEYWPKGVKINAKFISWEKFDKIMREQK